MAPPPADPPVERHSCGALDAVCRHCAALHFEGERTQRGGFSECCAQGKVALQPLGPIPRLLELLLTGDDPDSRNFRENIRRYNSALAMASFVSEVEMPPGEKLSLPRSPFPSPYSTPMKMLVRRPAKGAPSRSFYKSF